MRFGGSNRSSRHACPGDASCRPSSIKRSTQLVSSAFFIARQTEGNKKNNRSIRLPLRHPRRADPSRRCRRILEPPPPLWEHRRFGTAAAESRRRRHHFGTAAAVASGSPSYRCCSSLRHCRTRSTLAPHSVPPRFRRCRLHLAPFHRSRATRASAGPVAAGPARRSRVATKPSPQPSCLAWRRRTGRHRLESPLLPSTPDCVIAPGPARRRCAARPRPLPRLPVLAAPPQAPTAFGHRPPPPSCVTASP